MKGACQQPRARARSRIALGRANGVIQFEKMFLRTGTLVALSLVLISENAVAKNERETPISFTSASCFNVDFSNFPLVTMHGPEIIDVDPFGPTLLDWSITALATPTGFEFVEGTFAFHVKNKLLVGEYTGFSLDPLSGAYVLDWQFTGGTGRMHKVSGSGQTNGIADLTTFCAEYSFAGVLKDLPNWW